MMSHLEPHPSYITQDLETKEWWLVLKTATGEKFRVRVQPVDDFTRRHDDTPRTVVCAWEPEDV